MATGVRVKSAAADAQLLLLQWMHHNDALPSRSVEIELPGAREQL
jgi:hypothetical protein